MKTEEDEPKDVTIQFVIIVVIALIIIFSLGDYFGCSGGQSSLTIPTRF